MFKFSYNKSHKADNDAKEIAQLNTSDNNNEQKVVYTNDSDGAYHVEQDDETEEDSFVNTAPQ
jgi:hypothetical protein